MANVCPHMNEHHLMASCPCGYTSRAVSTFPASVTDPLSPAGDEITTTTDRRLLWHIESRLAVDAPVGSRLDALGRALREYLNASCQHHWQMHAAEPGIPTHRQCLWCNTVEWLS